MTRVNDPSPEEMDDRLAEFTNRVLVGEITDVVSNADGELRSLEETVLRLHRTLPQTSLDEAAVKQMQVRLNVRIRKEGAQTKPSFWSRSFLPNQVRPQFGLAFAAVALILAFVVLIPLLAAGGTPTTATALGSSQSAVAVVTLTGVMLLIFWMVRRK